MKGPKTDKWASSGRYMALFAVSLMYGILYWIEPEKVVPALNASVKIFGYILPPLAMVFILMILLNLFFKPAQVVRLLGEKAGLRGIVLSAAAGIISMGPIYAWYPLLQELKERGAGNTVIAVFLNNRAVKPFLLPVMISYFGWTYVLLLTFFMFITSVAFGYSLDALCKVTIRE